MEDAKQEQEILDTHNWGKPQNIIGTTGALEMPRRCLNCDQYEDSTRLIACASARRS